MDGFKAGTFSCQHAFLALALVLFSLYAAAIGLWHLLGRLQVKIWNFAEANWKRLQQSAILPPIQQLFPRGWIAAVDRLSPRRLSWLTFYHFAFRSFHCSGEFPRTC